MNTSNALTVLYDVLKDDALNNVTKLALVSDFEKVLSLGLLEEEKRSIDPELEQYILEKIQKRSEAKKNKDFHLADQIRNELAEKGVIIRDTREGTKYEIE